MEYIDEFERRFGISQEPFGLALNELQQAAESGHDVSAERERFAELDYTDEPALLELYEALPRTPPQTSPFFEASALVDILAVLPPPSRRAPDPQRLADRIRGAWHGRVVGNMLGKPVELGWDREQTERYLRSQGALPLTDYIPIPDVSVTALHASGFLLDSVVPYAAVSRGRIDGGVRDDDIDYTILGLHLVETYGPAYRTFDVAYEWLHRLPLYQTYTAERAAYNNLVREVPLDEVGEHRNPFREWIGALIRADVFGYVRPGDPRAAATMAYNDAVLSHRANGIYGAMWAAALISSAFVADSPDDALALSLAQIPPTSRLAAEIETVRADHRAGLSWEESIRGIDERHPGMSWVHTINNAGALTAALLWGDGDFTRTVGLAVLAGLDTDSIGATAGSWAGAFVGYDAIERHWVEPLHGRTRSALFGFDDVDLDDLAARTHRLVRTDRD